MKKAILLCCILLCIGYSMGNKTWKKRVLPQKYYFIKEEIVDNKNSTSKVNKQESGLRNDQINIYVGISKNQKLAEKILNMYPENSYQIEEIWIDNEELSMNIEQLDLLVRKATTNHEIKKIEEVALACYEEIAKRRE